MLTKNSEVDLVYAACTVECEGWIGTTGTGSVRVVVAMIDEEPIRLLHRLFTGGGLSISVRKGRRNLLRWQINGTQATDCLTAILPFMRTGSKRRQAQLVLLFEQGRQDLNEQEWKRRAAIETLLFKARKGVA